jgi:hypothetical protein
VTEATGSGGGRAEMERRIIQRSLEDDAFRGRLLEDPKAAVERELGKRLPEGVQVRVVEETADTIYLVLPGRSAGAQAGGGLSDRDLESVAGGDTWTCSGWTCGPNTCQSGQSTCGADCAG